MKKLAIAVIILGISISGNSANAATKIFKNCAELNKIYPGGVALPGALNSGSETKLQPKYDKALYTANKKSDCDKNGITCEDKFSTFYKVEEP